MVSTIIAPPSVSDCLTACESNCMIVSVSPLDADRILWRCSDRRESASTLRLQSYDSAQLTASDHFPVAAHFVLPVRQYNRCVKCHKPEFPLLSLRLSRSDCTIAVLIPVAAHFVLLQDNRCTECHKPCRTPCLCGQRYTAQRTHSVLPMTQNNRCAEYATGRQS